MFSFIYVLVLGFHEIRDKSVIKKYHFLEVLELPSSAKRQCICSMRLFSKWCDDNFVLIRDLSVLLSFVG